MNYQFPLLFEIPMWLLALVILGILSLSVEVLITLVFVAGASLAVAGFSAGRADSLRPLRMTALTLVLSAVLILIVDFDRPIQGFVQIDQTPYLDLIKQMETAVKENEAN